MGEGVSATGGGAAKRGGSGERIVQESEQGCGTPDASESNGVTDVDRKGHRRRKSFGSTRATKNGSAEASSVESSSSSRRFTGYDAAESELDSPPVGGKDEKR